MDSESRRNLIAMRSSSRTSAEAKRMGSNSSNHTIQGFFCCEKKLQKSVEHVQSEGSDGRIILESERQKLDDNVESETDKDKEEEEDPETE